MSEELFQKIVDEQNALESQHSPWDSEEHRAAYMDAFTQFLSSCDVTMDQFLDELERRIDLKKSTVGV